jgi:hypothetical protein
MTLKLSFGALVKRIARPRPGIASYDPLLHVVSAVEQVPFMMHTLYAEECRCDQQQYVSSTVTHASHMASKRLWL